MKTLIALLVVFLAVPAFAGGYGQGANAFADNFMKAFQGSQQNQRRQEVAPPVQQEAAPPVERQPMYNPHTGQWKVAPSDSYPQYNPHNSKWNLRQPGETTKYNPYTGKWE
jgi:hypothetical protein